MKIIAMLPVKNESWVLRHCLESLSFCDEILAIDDNSSDNTLEILKEFNCVIIPLDTKTQVGWKEFEIRSFLLAEARKRSATHILAIDGDEMFTDTFVNEARGIFSNLDTGESLSLPWVNVIDKNHIHQNPSVKTFAMKDDRVSLFKETFMHVPRVPNYTKGKVLDFPYAVLHFQYLNKVRNGYKQIWYMMSELIKGHRHPIRINATYTHTPPTVKEYPITKLTLQKLPNPVHDSSIWQKNAIRGMFSEHGILFFEPLNIWHLPELHTEFIKEIGREPQPVIAAPWLLALNNIKNKIKNEIYAHTFKNN